MNKKIDVSQQTVFDLFLIGNFTYESSVWDDAEGQRLRMEMCMIKRRRNLLQVPFTHFSPALRKALTTLSVSD